MTTPVTHRGITITQAEVPGAPFEWRHEEADAHGMAPTLARAKQQINVHLGSPDPDCKTCKGTGREDYAFLAYILCPTCQECAA